MSFFWIKYTEMEGGGDSAAMAAAEVNIEPNDICVTGTTGTAG